MCAFCARPAACGQLSVPTRRHPTSWSRQPPAKILLSEAKVPAKTDQGNEDVQLYAQASNQAKASSRGFPAAAPGTPREPRPHCAATAPGMLMRGRVWLPGRTSEIVHGKQRNPTQKKAFSVFLFLFFLFFSNEAGNKTSQPCKHTKTCCRQVEVKEQAPCQMLLSFQDWAGSSCSHFFP